MSLLLKIAATQEVIKLNGWTRKKVIETIGERKKGKRGKKGGGGFLYI